MKTKVLVKLSTLAIAAAFLLPACSRMAMNQEVQQNAISITADVDQSLSRATATRSAFQIGDQVGLFVVAYPLPSTQGTLLGEGNYIDNVSFTRGSGTPSWVADGSAYYPPVAVDIYAYAPYEADFSYDGDMTQYPFTVDADQSTSTKIYENDLMTAQKINSSSADATVPLTFYHRLARVDVTLTLPSTFQGTTVKSLKSVSVLNTELTASVDFSTAHTYSSTGGENAGDYPKPATVHSTSQKGEISMSLATTHTYNSFTYEAIVVPQTFDTGYEMIEVVIELTDGRTEIYNYVVKDDEIVTKSSHVTSLELTFAADNQLQLAGITIQDWTTETTAGDIVENEVYNNFEVTLDSEPASTVTAVVVTAKQGNNPDTASTKTYTVNATSTGKVVEFKFDALNPGPEYYPFTITNIECKITNAASVNVTEETTVTKTGTVTIAQ